MVNFLNEVLSKAVKSERICRWGGSWAETPLRRSLTCARASSAKKAAKNRLIKPHNMAPSLGRPIFVDYPLGCDHQRVVFPLVRVDIYPN